MKAADLITKIRNALMDQPMFVKVVSIALGMVVILGASMVWQIQYSYYRLETREVDDHALFIAKVLAAGAAPLLRAGNLVGVQRLVDDMAQVDPEISDVQVLDRQGRVVARTIHPSGFDPKEQEHDGTVMLADDLGGRIAVALDDSHVDFELGWHSHHILITSAIIALLGMAATWVLMRTVNRPILELVQSTRAVKEGDYQTRAPVRAKDEVGELAAAFNDMMAALQQKDAVNRQLLRKIITAEEEERGRIARELHDHTGQVVTSLIAGLAALKTREPSEKLSDLLGLATQILGEVHDLSLALRPSALEDLGLVPALQKFCRGMAQRYGVKVDCATIGLDAARLPAEIEVALYRIGQEALTNAVRHGQAHSVEVLLQRKTASVLAVIEDDGQGFEAHDWRARCLRGDHLGLLGIEERAVLLGGNLRVESRRGAGTSLFVEIPLVEIAHG